MLNFIATLKALPDFYSSKPANETDISNAETELAVRFAVEYREYLAVFGQADANGHEFTGIVESERLNVVSVTKHEWEINPQVPHTMYVVENAGIDGIVIWQDASGTVYQSEPNMNPQIISDALNNFVQ
jgi:hypothetical protein